MCIIVYYEVLLCQNIWDLLKGGNVVEDHFENGSENRLKSHQHNDAFKKIQGQNKLHFAARDAVAHLKLKERSVSNFWDCCKDVEMGEYLGQLYRNWNCYNFDEHKSSTYLQNCTISTVCKNSTFDIIFCNCSTM